MRARTTPCPARLRGLACLTGLAFLLVLPASLGALELKVSELAFLPARFGPGEEVEAFALVEPVGGEPVAFEASKGAGFAPSGTEADPEPLSVSLRKGREGWELRLRFIAWSPGKGRLPAMDLHGVRIPALPYEASSILGPGDREARPPRPQLDPPGTAIYLYGFLGALVLLALAGFASVAWLIPSARRLLADWKAGEARRALAKSLDWLGQELSGKGGAPVDPAAFHAVLARALRLYLSARVIPEAPALTPSELARLEEGRFPAEGLRDEAAALLAESDEVRFAGAKAGPAELRAALARAARLGDLSEEALDARL